MRATLFALLLLISLGYGQERDEATSLFSEEESGQHRVFFPRVEEHLPKSFGEKIAIVHNDRNGVEYFVYSIDDDWLRIVPAISLAHEERFSISISHWFGDLWAVSLHFYSERDGNGESLGFCSEFEPSKNLKNEIRKLAKRIVNAFRAGETPRAQDIQALWFALENREILNFDSNP